LSDDWKRCDSERKAIFSCLVLRTSLAFGRAVVVSRRLFFGTPKRTIAGFANVSRVHCICSRRDANLESRYGIPSSTAGLCLSMLAEKCAERRVRRLAYFRLCLMIGRGTVGEATVLNPARAKVVAYPVLVALGDLVASRG
jgi:hypothetical protein